MSRMRMLRSVAPIVIGGVVVSGVIVFVSGLWFIETDDLVGPDKDWAGFGGAIAMGFFAFMVGILSTLVVAALARWFPAGLIGFAAVAVGVGIYVTTVALDQKPVLAPMFVVLHVVFVGAFGILLPWRVLASRRTAGSRLTLVR